MFPILELWIKHYIKTLTEIKAIYSITDGLHVANIKEFNQSTFHSNWLLATLLIVLYYMKNILNIKDEQLRWSYTT